MAPLRAPLVEKGRGVVKPRTWFGYLPLWQETFPLNPDTGKVDFVRVAANMIAGAIIGIRQTLSAIVSATLVFTTTDNPVITEMFPFGISMMWWSTIAGSLFYGVFGRLQYNTNATQEVCAILYGAMASKAAVRLADDPERIPPTVLALIATGTVLTGVCSVLFGKLGVGKFMLSFPTPVTSGFLGTIGFFLIKQALQITSGVPFKYFYPVSFGDFVAPRSAFPLMSLFAMVMFMRRGPKLLSSAFPSNATVKKLAGLICQLLPLGVFYVVICFLRVDLDECSDAGWTYPSQAPKVFTSLWTTYKLSDADWQLVVSFLPDMMSLVLLSALCTMTGVLGITGKFPSGPDGDPAPDDVTDFDVELTTVGVGAVLTGLTNGVVTFHRLGSSIQLRSDGGTHRIAVLTSACFVSIFFFSSVPLGHFVPKFFLGGLFMGSGVSFLEGVFYSYKSMGSSAMVLFGRKLPSAHYWIALACIAVAAFTSPFDGIGVGLVLSLLLFLEQSASSEPVASISDGRSTVARTMRPVWELQALRQHGDQIVILYLQGQLFFGSGQRLASAIARTLEQRSPTYCILSFAKVPGIDVSAVEFLKSAQKRAKRNGCTLVFCRMHPDVFSALSAAQLITSPNADLRKLVEGGPRDDEAQAHVIDLDRPGGNGDGAHRESEHLEELQGVHVGPSQGLVRCMSSTHSFQPLSSGIHDAFDHETDALDYCAEQVLSRTTYADGARLDDVQQAYRVACRNGSRLPEAMFEQLNRMPPGTMQRLRPHCRVHQDCRPKDVLHARNSLNFVLQGAVSMVDTSEGERSSVANLAQALHISPKGFHGRGGKRLRKRYPPGCVLGKTAFLLHQNARVCDQQVMSELVVSDKFGRTTEVWVLGEESWRQLPEDLRRVVGELMLLQLAEERQHTFLSGE